MYTLTMTLTFHLFMLTQGHTIISGNWIAVKLLLWQLWVTVPETVVSKSYLPALMFF